jgi:hypothetical protein
MGLDSRRTHNLLLLVFLLGVVVSIPGCGRIMVGGGEDSPDKKYSLGVSTAGAYNHAYYDDTRKTVSITIYTNDGRWTELLAQTYRVRGSDLGWNCAWDEHDNITLTLHDYGPGVSHYDLKTNSPPKRILRTLRYQLDPKNGGFTEQ